MSPNRSRSPRRRRPVGALPAIFVLALGTGCALAPWRRCPPRPRMECGADVRIQIVPLQSTVRSGERMTFEISLENAGDEPALLRLEGDHGVIDPILRFVRSDGVTFRCPTSRELAANDPWPTPQIARELKPGEIQLDRLWLREVDSTDSTCGPARRWFLPPGAYRVTCEYAQPDDVIDPSHGCHGASAPVHVPNLWTGTLVTECGPLTVLPAERVLQRWDVASAFTPGEPFVVRVTIENHERAAIRLDANPALLAGHPMIPIGYHARMTLAPGTADVDVVVEPGERREFSADLRQLTWTESPSGDAISFDDAFPPGAPGLLLTHVEVRSREETFIPLSSWFWVTPPGSNAADLPARIGPESPRSGEPPTVVPASHPTLAVSALIYGGAGESMPMRVIVTNPTSAPLALTRALELSLRSDRADTPWATSVPWADRVCPARYHRALTIDLTAHTWKTASDPSREIGLFDRGAHRDLELKARFVDAGGLVLLESESVPVPMSSLGGTDSPLRLTAVPIEGTEAAVDVVLRNDGAEPIEIPFPILYPAELCLSITPEHGSRIEGLPAGGEPIPLAEAFAERPEGTEWDAGAFETATVPLGARRRTLAPNEEVRRRFTLARLFRGALAPGVYEVTPTWGNFESGRRLGLPGPLIHTGVVTRLAPGQWLYEGPVRVRGCKVVVR